MARTKNLTLDEQIKQNEAQLLSDLDIDSSSVKDDGPIQQAEDLTHSDEEKINELSAKLEAATEEIENLNSLIEELRTAQAFNKTEDVKSTANATEDYKALYAFYELITKYLVRNSQTGIYSLAVNFSGPKGQSIIKDCLKRFPVRK